MSSTDYIDLVKRMRKAQKAYWHFTGEKTMKRRLLEFALELEAQVDQAQILDAPVATTAGTPLHPFPVLTAEDLTPETVEQFKKLLQEPKRQPMVLVDPRAGLRYQEEVQKAHDMLAGIVLGEVPTDQYSPDMMLGIRSSLDVLCWVLQHDHNDSFATNFARILEDLKARGFELEFKDIGPKVQALQEPGWKPEKPWPRWPPAPPDHIR